MKMEKSSDGSYLTVSLGGIPSSASSASKPADTAGAAGAGAVAEISVRIYARPLLIHVFHRGQLVFSANARGLLRFEATRSARDAQGAIRAAIRGY